MTTTHHHHHPAPHQPKERSYNGWPASKDPKDIDVVPLVVNGVSFVGGVRDGDVHTVHEYFWTQFDRRVERLVNPGCWGHSYRKNKNANNLSCHSSATATDGNAPQHPNGIEATKNFSHAQIAEIHKILVSVEELDEVLHWGGDWHEPQLTPDPMHVEIHDHDLEKLARVAARIRQGDLTHPIPRKESHMNNVQYGRKLITAGLVELAKAADRPVVRAQAALIRAALLVMPRK